VSDVKQAVGGFKVLNYSVKKGKEDEKLRVVLEASVAEITAGECDVGQVMKALLDHATGETEVGLSLFVAKKS
jgi:uncharacterized protein YqeY